MKTRIWLLVLAWMLAWNMQAQSYAVLWKNVEQMEKKDLPKSVIDESRRIYDKAKAERNVPQMMKAYLTMMTWRGNISPDSLTMDIQGLEAWLQEPGLALQDKAVLNSILGGVFIREDFEKGNRYLNLSLKDSLKLVDYPADKLVPMVKSGKTSQQYFDNNLYDLLARRAIRLWGENRWGAQRERVERSIQETYQSLLYIYKVRGMRSAWLLTALDAYPQASEKQLREWMKEFGDLEVCAGVYLRLATILKWEERLVESLSTLREGIGRYPHYEGISFLKNMEQEIQKPGLSLSVTYVYPGKPMDVKVNHRNLKGFSIALYRINLPAESALLSEVDLENIKRFGTFLRREHFEVPPTPDYRERTDTVQMTIDEAGIYYLVTEPDGYPKVRQGIQVNVSSLLLIGRGLPGDKQELVVLDKQSGHPVPGAVVGIYKRDGNGFDKIISYKSNAEGMVLLKDAGDRNVFTQAFTYDDEAMSIHWRRFTKVRERLNVRKEELVQMFTDRSIYRPGQKVYFSGIAYSQRGDEKQTEEGVAYNIVLKDADYQEVAKQEVKTDAFGTFHGTFDLPKTGKMGVYHLETRKGSVSFRVEEYKRPTFEVTFDTVRTSYQAGDSILATGVARTFAGAPVQGAKVSYQVLRLENGLWRMRGVETHRVAGETVTDAEGRFEVPVKFLPVAESEHSWFHTYEVVADVTSMAGETQEGTLSLPLGSSLLRIWISGLDNETLVKEQPKELTISVANLKGVPVDAEVEGKIYTLLEGGKLGACVWQGPLVANRSTVPEALYALPSGRYQLQVSGKDEAGHESGHKADFVLFSLEDKHLPYPTDVWCHQVSVETDGTTTIYFGSKEKDVCLFFDAYTENGRVESKRIHFSDSLLAFRYTYKEEYGSGLRLSFAFAKNGEVYARYFELPKPKPDKRLLLKWKTFRDKLLPGSQETWTLSIFRPDGNPADAQLLATMYDASLDQLAPHHWHMALEFGRFIPTYYWNANQSSQIYWGCSFPVKSLKLNPLAYSQLDIPGGFAAEEQALRMYKAGVALGGVRNTNGVVYESKFVSTADALNVAEEMTTEESVLGSTDKVQLRTNFAETAFFYPNLRTNASGEVSIEFTLPENLTEWKFMGLAHTREMDYGMITDKVVATKDFMLQPNLPRFVRVGDRVNVAASLINLSDKEVKGIVRMEIFVPETEKIVVKQKRSFVVKAGETGKASFDFEVTDKYEGLAVRMVADGDTFGDGEQRFLPVLSNKQKLTESILLNVNGKGTYTYSLETLFNHHSKSVSHPKMVVEFTGNPMWYAVQALKVVSNPETDNALSWASAYYANALLAHLVETEPRIADSLKVEGLDVKLAEAVLKLKDLQLEDGSWSWYKGMSGSVYMTTAITQLLARLQQMTGTPLQGDVMQMYRKAADCLYKQVEADVQRIDEALKQGAVHILPSETTMQYLYMHALDKNLPMLQRIQLKLMTLMTEHPEAFTIYGKALSAIIFQESGKKAEAKEFLESLMQYSVMTEDMGRYFDTPKAHYSWLSYKIPTQVAAIEAVKRVTNEEKTQEEMKQWLLKQKQAQAWDTPIATTDAVYVLLTTGADVLASVGENEIQIRAGEIMIREDGSENREGESMGYISRQIQGDVMKFRKVTVKRESAGIAWGAVYAEFEEDMDKVIAQGNALKVARVLYKDGKPLAEGGALEVGEKLTVRLTVVADRDMDFVQVKDERAACLEPVDALSGYRWNGQVGYYQETKDASTSFYLDRMRKGAYELTYDVYVTSSGVYQQGIATARSVYAPEFGGHSSSSTLVIQNTMGKENAK